MGALKAAAAVMVLALLAPPATLQAARKRPTRATPVEPGRSGTPALPAPASDSDGPRIASARPAAPDPMLEAISGDHELPPDPVGIAAAEAPRTGAEGPLALPANPLVFSPGDPVPLGYLPIPSARTALRVAGFLKLDAIHDTGPYTGDASDLPGLVLRGGPGGGQREGLTRLHARESRLSLGTFTDTAAGPVVAFLEVDFFGSAGVNTYGLRMRHAYLSWKSLLAGHTYSNFLDVEARGTTIEFNGPTAAGNRKRAQIRLTRELASGVMAAIAVENGAADYTTAKGARVTAADTLLDLGSDVVQQVPDVTGHLRFQSLAGHLAMRTMARQLRVLSPGGPGPPLVRYGYGLAVSGRWLYDGPSNLIAQATGGRGIGGYVDDLDGQAATFDQAGQRFVPQVGYAALVGAEQYLSPQWRFNLIASASGIRLPDVAPSGPDVPPISKRFLQLFINLLYAPAPGLLMGIEYGYYRRETNTPLAGWSHRLQLGILYRFGG